MWVPYIDAYQNVNQTSDIISSSLKKRYSYFTIGVISTSSHTRSDKHPVNNFKLRASMWAHTTARRPSPLSPYQLLFCSSARISQDSESKQLHLREKLQMKQRDKGGAEQEGDKMAQRYKQDTWTCNACIKRHLNQIRNNMYNWSDFTGYYFVIGPLVQ